jgi:predicted phosphoribosyltransferase
MFNDRMDAGRQLAAALAEFKDRKETLVMALPRGGVVPAYVIARELHLPLEVAMIKKLGHPQNPEFAIGAVSLKNFVVNGHAGVSSQYIESKAREIQSQLEARYRLYHGGKPPAEVGGKTVIIVDDGVATGKTLFAAIDLIRQDKPKRIVVAVPVGPTFIISRLKKLADRVICLDARDDLYAIGLHYLDFGEVSDQAVQQMLSAIERERAAR